MMFLELNELLEKAARASELTEAVKVASVDEDPDDSYEYVLSELTRLLAEAPMEKRASRVAVAKLMLAIDVLSDQN
jgi:phosphate uptake regulator